MLTRRSFLKLGAMTGAGLMLPPIMTRKAYAALPTVVDALYTAPILDPSAVPQFVNPLPVVEALGLRVNATSGGSFSARMGTATQNLLGGGLGLMTSVWGYGIGSGPVTYPGATFVAMSGVPVDVNWANDLGNFYLLRQGADTTKDVVDRTLHWAFGDVQGNTSFGSNGIPAVAHLHGGHTDSAYDGLPEQWFTRNRRGNEYVTSRYTYDNSQEAATLWYHDHALGITRTNVYGGLAGFYLLRDDNENYLISNDMIPSGPFEIEIVIQDRMFYPDGRLAYPDAAVAGVQPSVQPEFFGQVILVNGKAWPFLSVEPRQYRLRLLNGSDSRFYTLSIPGASILQIGTDGGLLNNPVPLSQLTFGPGERADVVVDFSMAAGKRLIMTNGAKIPFPNGVTPTPALDGRIMAFRVGPTTSGGVSSPVTPMTNLRPVSGPLPAISTRRVSTRKLMLFEGTDHFGRLQPLLGTVPEGTFLWSDPITENPRFGATEIWEIHNATADAHPIHLHLVEFQIVNRQKFTATIVPKNLTDQNGNITVGGALTGIRYKGNPKGPAANEAGFKDTAIMYPGEVTRVIATFDKQGRWVWHCHILSHEDHEMMRPYEVV